MIYLILSYFILFYFIFILCYLLLLLLLLLLFYLFNFICYVMLFYVILFHLYLFYLNEPSVGLSNGKLVIKNHDSPLSCLYIFTLAIQHFVENIRDQSN